MKEIKLNKGFVALVDDEDYDSLMKYKWVAHKHRNTWYAYSSIYENAKRIGIKMHRIVMGATKGMPDVDHENGNGLDNQKSNLRFCTNSQNAQNRQRQKNGSSPYKGVSVYIVRGYHHKEKYNRNTERAMWLTSVKRWKAQIMADGKVRHLGYFPFTPEGEIQAAQTYNEAAKKYFGEFARLNNVPELPQELKSTAEQ